MTDIELREIFEKFNQEHFSGALALPVLRWNKRLRSSAGRFVPGSYRFLTTIHPVIEIASYLKTEERARELIADTLGHEMIHYWLWARRKPYGHTPEFWKKMQEMGVSRYNSVPRSRPYKYVYACPGCEKEFKTRKRLGRLACASCCNQHNRGKFDFRFKLVLKKELESVNAR